MASHSSNGPCAHPYPQRIARSTSSIECAMSGATRAANQRGRERAAQAIADLIRPRQTTCGPAARCRAGPVRPPAKAESPAFEARIPSCSGRATKCPSRLTGRSFAGRNRGRPSRRSSLARPCRERTAAVRRRGDSSIRSNPLCEIRRHVEQHVKARNIQGAEVALFGRPKCRSRDRVDFLHGNTSGRHVMKDSNEAVECDVIGDEAGRILGDNDVFPQPSIRKGGHGVQDGGVGFGGRHELK